VLSDNCFCAFFRDGFLPGTNEFLSNRIRVSKPSYYGLDHDVSGNTVHVAARHVLIQYAQGLSSEHFFRLSLSSKQQQIGHIIPTMSTSSITLWSPSLL